MKHIRFLFVGILLSLTVLVTPAAAANDGVYSNTYGRIDCTTAEDGYVTVQYTARSNKKIKCLVTGPEGSYNYTVQCGQDVQVSLNLGEGKYTVALLENTDGNRYVNKAKTTFTVDFADDMAPFLASNPYVSWNGNDDLLKAVNEAIAGCKTDEEKVNAVYAYVARNIDYDFEKAAVVPDGYVTDITDILEIKKGICLDYSAIMVGMLRSQGIPCKLVIGDWKGAYHAWVEVYDVNSDTWQRFDPTYGAACGPDAMQTAAGGDEAYAAEKWY